MKTLGRRRATLWLVMALSVSIGSASGRNGEERGAMGMAGLVAEPAGKSIRFTD
jgi:hypothetical protein